MPALMTNCKCSMCVRASAFVDHHSPPIALIILTSTFVAQCFFYTYSHLESLIVDSSYVLTSFSTTLERQGRYVQALRGGGGGGER